MKKFLEEIYNEKYECKKEKHLKKKKKKKEKEIKKQ